MQPLRATARSRQAKPATSGSGQWYDFLGPWKIPAFVACLVIGMAVWYFRSTGHLNPRFSSLSPGISRKAAVDIMGSPYKSGRKFSIWRADAAQFSIGTRSHRHAPDWTLYVAWYDNQDKLVATKRMDDSEEGSVSDIPPAR